MMNQICCTGQWRHKSQTYSGFTSELVQEGCARGYHWAVVKTTRTRRKECSWDWLERLEMKIDISKFNYAFKLLCQGRLHMPSIDLNDVLRTCERLRCLHAISNVSPSPWDSGYGVCVYINVIMDTSFSPDETLQKVIEGQTAWLTESDFSNVANEIIAEFSSLFTEFESCNVLTMPGYDTFDYEVRAK